MAKRALILDFDGVIVETEALHFLCWNRVFEETYGVTVSGDHRQLVGLSLAQIYDLWCSLPQPPLLLSPEQGHALLNRKTELFYELGPEHLRPNEGIIELAIHAREAGWYVVVASRALRMRLLRTLEIVGIAFPFDLIMGSEDLVDPVTDRKRHSRAVTPFAIEPADCIVIEDSASGVRDAKADGIGRVIGLTTSLDRESLLRAGADRVIEELIEAQGEIRSVGE